MKSYDLTCAFTRRGFFYEDEQVIDHNRKGMGLAQRLIVNAVDLADSMGARSAEFDINEIGGDVWAKAGLVPRDWTSLRLQVEARLGALQRSFGKVGAAEETTINAMLSRGEMGYGSEACRKREIDTYAVSAARAQRRAGWSEARIAEAYGEMPPIHLSLDEMLDHNARVGAKTLKRTILGDESFQGDP